MKPITRLFALAILLLATPIAQAGLITVTSSRIYHLQIATVPSGFKDLERDVFTFPAAIRGSQLLVTTDFGQATNTFNGSASLSGGTPQTLTAELTGNLNVRSPVNVAPKGLSYQSEAYLTTFFSIDITVNERVDSDLQFVAGVSDIRSIQTGASLSNPYTNLSGRLRNLTTNTTLASFTTTGNWRGRLDPGSYRIFGLLDVARILYGGTTGDPSVTSFVNANGVVRSTLRVTPVPEPATLSLGTIGVVLLGTRRIKRRS